MIGGANDDPAHANISNNENNVSDCIQTFQEKKSSSIFFLSALKKVAKKSRIYKEIYRRVKEVLGLAASTKRSTDASDFSNKARRRGVFIGIRSLKSELDSAVGGEVQ